MQRGERERRKVPGDAGKVVPGSRADCIRCDGKRCIDTDAKLIPGWIVAMCSKCKLAWLESKEEYVGESWEPTKFVDTEVFFPGEHTETELRKRAWELDGLRRVQEMMDSDIEDARWERIVQ